MTSKLASAIGRVTTEVFQKGGGKKTHKTHDALKVVGLAVLDQHRDDERGQEEGDRLERLEVERHVAVHDPAEDDEEGGDEEGDLQAAADGDADGEVHLVLVRDDNGGDVLGGVADDGDEDEADEGPTDVCRLDDRANAVDEVLGANSHGDRDDDQDDAGGPGRQQFGLGVLV